MFCREVLLSCTFLADQGLWFVTAPNGAIKAARQVCTVSEEYCEVIANKSAFSKQKPLAMQAATQALT